MLTPLNPVPSHLSEAPEESRLRRKERKIGFRVLRCLKVLVFRIQGVWFSQFGVWEFGFRVWGLGLGFGNWGLGFGV